MSVARVVCVCLLMICHVRFTGTEPAMGQETNVVTISGVVLDANNARVVDTLIKIENASIKRRVRSDDEATFRVEVPPGDYQIIAEHEGFKRFEFSPFHAQAGACELVNIHLEVAIPKSTLKVN